MSTFYADPVALRGAVRRLERRVAELEAERDEAFALRDEALEAQEFSDVESESLRRVLRLLWLFAFPGTVPPLVDLEVRRDGLLWSRDSVRNREILSRELARFFGEGARSAPWDINTEEGVLYSKGQEGSGTELTESSLTD